MKDGIRYRMRVRSGPNGVLDEEGKKLKEPAEWFFWTMVNLDGQTENYYPPNTQNGKFNNKDKLQITWFNVSRNEDLIPGRPVVNRIYVLWDKKNDVYDEDQVSEFDADVTLEVNGEPYKRPNITIKRPDKYGSIDKKHAMNTINFYRDDSAKGDESYHLKIEPKPQTNTPRVFEKEATAKVRGSVKSISFFYWACEMAGWYNGVNPTELDSAKKTLANECDFTARVFPIVSCIGNDTNKVISRDPGGFNMEFTKIGTSKKYGENVRFVRDLTTGTEIEEADLVAIHLLQRAYTQNKAPDKFVVGLVPLGFLPNNEGVRYGYMLKNGDVINAILLTDNNTGVTLTHELGHRYGLAKNPDKGCVENHNSDPTKIEGFNPYTMSNKSYKEGNSDSDSFMYPSCDDSYLYSPDPSVSSLMFPYTRYSNSGVVTTYNTRTTWIRWDDYEHLLSQFVSGASPKGNNKNAVSDSRSQLDTGDFMVVMGYINSSGKIESISPLYNVTKRNFDEPGGSAYKAELFSEENGKGTSFGSYNFGTVNITIHSDDGNAETIASGMFLFAIPFNSSAQSLVIKGQNNSVTINKSDHGIAAPIADFIYPTNGSTISGTVNVTWNGSDDGGGTIYYGLEYSDDGTAWVPLATLMADVTTYSLDTTSFPTGSNQKLALIASDGFNTTRKEIDINISNFVNVNRTTPLKGAEDVSEWQMIDVYFISDMDENTIDTNTFLLYEGANQVEGEVKYDSDNRKASFFPKEKLKSNTTYTAQLVAGEGGIRDINGNTLESDYEWQFTTVNTLPSRGQISGYVVDTKGNFIESVKLKLKGKETKITKNLYSDSAGFFEFLDLEADIYKIKANKKGYKVSKQKVNVEDGEKKEITILMKKE